MIEPTPEQEQTICAFLRAGCFLPVAAEAAGVPRARLEYWLRRARRRPLNEPCRRLAESVRRAVAHARLAAETAVLKARPLDWLRYGPGRPTATTVGWTSSAKPHAPGDQADVPTEALLRRLVAQLLEALEPYPEARAAAAAVLEGGDPQRPSEDE